MSRWLQLVLGTWLLVAVAGCALVEGGCGCGADPNDPLSDHDMSFAGNHVVNDQCVCHCGGDEPEVFSNAQACGHYEVACKDSLGREHTSICY